MAINNITFTNTSADKRVTIGTTNVDYNLTNSLGTPISQPSTGETSAISTKVVNLLKIVERFVINGNISTGLATQGTSPIERTDAKDVKDDLITLAKTRAVKKTPTSWTVMNYEGTDYYVTFEKVSIKENSYDLTDDAPDGVMRYDVVISVVVGEPIV